MPTLEWNKNLWDGAYDWGNKGEIWSKRWGGCEAQWFGTLYPRIHRFLPADHILEIAPGYGRWTGFLLEHARTGYQGVDISAECATACTERYQDVDKASFFQNDGLDLSCIEDGSVDFVFSFDSLVHVDMGVLSSYIPQLLRKLRGDGVAFIHHSNRADSGETSRNEQSRDEGVSARLVAELVRKNGGVMLIQECVNWKSEGLIDAFSVFARSGSRWQDSATVISNPHFDEEARRISETQAFYASL